MSTRFDASARSPVASPLTTATGAPDASDGGARHAEIDGARGGDRRVLAHDAPRELAQVDRREAALDDAGLLAREREHLLDEMRRTHEAGFQLRERRSPIRVVVGPFGQLRLQVDRGERRPELVRRVGDERSLRAERAVEAGEQSVQCLRERANLCGQARLVERREPARSALGDRGREAPEWRESAHHAPADGKREQRRDDEQRHDRPQRHAGCELAPSAHRLRDLDDLVACERAEHTPVAGRGLHRVEAELRVLRQRLLRLR